MVYLFLIILSFASIIQSIKNMKSQDFTIVLILILCISSKASASLWNQLVAFECIIQQKDFTTQQSNPKNSKYYQRPYKLNILSDNSFYFEIQQDNENLKYSAEGETQFKADFSLNSKTYQLKSIVSHKLKGQVTYQTAWGVTWKYNIKLEQINIKIQRSEVRYAYLNIILLILFGLGGVLIFSISDRARVKILFDLRKRTHPLALMIIILKAAWAIGCFIIIGYGSILALSIFFLLFLYGIYLFTLSPSIIHILYFIAAAQRGLGQMQFYKSKSIINQFIIFIASIVIFGLIYFASFLLQKGIIFLYILSFNTIFIYLYCLKTKKFAYGSLIIYDAFLNGILEIIMLYLPVGNFILTSYKQIILFCNYFLFLFVFSMIFMKKLIKSQIVEQIHLQQYSTKDVPESERRNQENKTPQSVEMIEQ